MSLLVSKILIGLGVYAASLVILSVAVFLFVHFQTKLSGDGIFRRTWLWIGRWHLLVVLITMAGAIAGSMLYPLFGQLIGMNMPVGEMLNNGAKDGGFYAFIWAPGISFVSCLIWRNRGKSTNHSG